MLAARNLPSPIATGDDHRARCPTSPLERKAQSPKGWMKRESEGIGLGIVAKLGEARRREDETAAEIAIGSWLADGKGRAGRRADDGNPSPAIEGFQVADFLACCYLCKKRLHGKDIYMYRGEKAFCSIECRYQQIVSDECLEK